MSQIDENDLVSRIFVGEFFWDTFIESNENIISLKNNHEIIMKIFDILELVSNSADNKVGYSLLKNQI